MGIVVFGAVFVDIKGYPQAQYIPAGRNMGRVVQVHGGVARNIAENIANVELHPTFVSVVDHSGISTDVVAKLKNAGVKTKYMRRVDDGLGTWLAVFNNKGDVVASISKRPDLSEIDNVLDEFGDKIISEADSVVVEIDMEQKTLDKIFALAAKHRKVVYAVVSNMSIALERRGMLRQTGCIVCNHQEASILFSEIEEDMSAEQIMEVLPKKISQAAIRSMIVTMGENGAVYADMHGNCGHIPAKKVDVIDTTGAGDAFFSGVAIGLTYHLDLKSACEVGSTLAASVIATDEAVCPHFMPQEFGLSI